jgi:hypothetical protein
MNSINALAIGVAGHTPKNASTDRRREPRALTAAIAQLVQADLCEIECVLENLSLTGACVYVQTRLTAGAHAWLIVSTVERNVIVKHCSPHGRGFKVGLEFVNEHWPERVVGPFHWIRPAR